MTRSKLRPPTTQLHSHAVDLTFAQNGLASETDLHLVVDPHVIEPLQLGDLLTAKFLKKQSGFLISLILHLFLLFILSVVLIQVGTGQPLLILEALVEPLEKELLEMEVVFAVEAEDIPFELVGLDNKLEETSLPQVVPESDTKQMAEEIVEPIRSRGKQGDGRSTEFFGTRIQGNTFVFVIDRSTSMAYIPERFKTRSQIPDQLTRFKAASAELMRSINQLTEDQQFYVVLFSSKTVRMFDDKSLLPKPIVASEENKIRLKTWLDNLVIDGGTDPRDALDIALKMRPDAIFMLSDGEFGSHVPGSADGSLEIVKDNNLGRVPVHTIALEDEASKKNMAEIAEASGGEFRFVKIYNHLLSRMESTDPYEQIEALDHVKSLIQVDWSIRLQMANRAIGILDQANPESQAHASAILHWLSFDLFKNQIAPVAPQHKTESVRRSSQLWKTTWRHADDIVQKLRQGKKTTDLATSEPPEPMALAIFGEFDRLNSLSPVRALALKMEDKERKENISNSLQAFQAQYSTDDPYVLMESPNLKSRADGLNRLLQSPLSWRERFEIANSHLMPLLDDPDELSRRFAENAMHQLTFELLREPVTGPNVILSRLERKAMIANWDAFWSQLNDALKMDREKRPADGLAFEQQLMFAFAQFPKSKDLAPVVEFAEMDLAIAHKVKFVTSLLEFQKQYGVTIESRDALLKVCCELAQFSSNQKQKWAKTASLKVCTDCLKKTLRKRSLNAQKMYRNVMNTNVDKPRRIKIAQTLLEDYPETKYAHMLKQNGVP